MLTMMSPLAPMRILDDMMITDALMRGGFLTSAPHCYLTSTAPHITEVADKITVSITAPGVAPADLTIEAIDDSRLSVRGRTEAEAHSHVVNYTVQLPAHADAANASAEAADGLITVSVPKKTAMAPTVIAISAATSQDDDDKGDDKDSDDAPSPYTLTVAAAGIAASDLTLSVEAAGVGGGSVLKVAGSSARTGSLVDRHYRLAKDADAEKARASHVDGLLTVLIPRRAAPEKTVIAVNAATSVAMKAEEGDRA